MISNYFKIAWRNLARKKAFSLINIAGLSVGLAAFILIMLWVKNEMSYDGFHQDKHRIGAVMLNQTYANNEKATFPATPPLLAAAMKNDLPGVEHATRTSWGDVRLFTKGDQYSSEYGLYVDPEFLDVFSFPLVKSRAGKLLTEPNTVLISEKLAAKYFGEENPIGQTILIENTRPYKVEGVLRDVPSNATLRFDFLMPMKDYIDWALGGKTSWDQFNTRTYVKLKEGVDRAAFDKGLLKFLNNYTPEKNKSEMFVWDLKDWYLRFDFKDGRYNGGGRIAYVRLFIIIACFILLLACINFMNLSTARATQRAREVGVKKVLGAGRKNLVAQFIGESVLLSLLSAAIALLIVILVLPAFNAFLKKTIAIDYADGLSVFVFVAIVLITGVLAGSYPAWVLSAFKPVRVLKGLPFKMPGSAAGVRKTLVVVQFAVSILLIIGTIVIKRQVDFIRSKELGYDRQHLLWFPNTVAQDISDRGVEEFKRVRGVTHVSRGSMTFTSPNSRGTDVHWPGKKTGEEIFFNFITSDHDIIQTMGITMKEGRAFSKDFATDTSAFIVNEEAVRRMGLVDPVGQVIETGGIKGPIVGVTRDFHFESMHNPIGPVIIQCKPEWTWLFYVRTDGRDIQQTLRGLEDVYKRMAPGTVFDYTFQDKEYERLFRSESQIGTLVNWFAFLAIFISCLGLLGLTIYTVERKMKEIGIRKVLGASVPAIVRLLSKELLLLVGISALIAFPLAWWAMQSWLADFAYRISVSWWIFLAAGLLAASIALLTIGVQAIRAALSNPIESLRNE